jgi:hypothetical protein
MRQQWPSPASAEEHETALAKHVAVVPAKLSQSSRRASICTCQIGPIIPTHIDFKREVCIPTKCIHYASENPLDYFGFGFGPCAVIKAMGGCKIMHPHFFMYWSPFPKPKAPIYITISCITTPQAYL